MAKQINFRDVNTGIIRAYPASLAATFPNLVPVDEEEPCYTCGAADPTPEDPTDSAAAVAWDDDAPNVEEEEDDE